MALSERSKGKRGERRVCMVCKAAGIPAERNLEQSRDGGDDIVWDLPIACEVKHQKTHSAWARALEQARRAAEPQSKWWIAWTHADHGDGVVHMPEELFVAMAADLRRAGIW